MEIIIYKSSQAYPSHIIELEKDPKKKLPKIY